MTIPVSTESPTQSGMDASEMALAALGWILEDMERAERFLSLTGMTPETLREGILTAQVQAAVLEFLANHEPDLIRAAEALAVTPQELIAAHRELSA